MLSVANAVRFYADAFIVARTGVVIQCGVLVRAWRIVFFVYQ